MGEKCAQAWEPPGFGEFRILPEYGPPRDSVVTDCESRPRRAAPRPELHALRQRLVEHHHLADSLRRDEPDQPSGVVDHGDRGRRFLLQQAERVLETAA